MSTANNHEAIQLAKRVANRLAAIKNIAAIALGGSLARGTSYPDSDIDIGIYYSDTQPLSQKDLNQLASELDDSHSVNLITKPGEWGTWINGGGWLKINDQAVDWLYRNNTAVSKVIDDCCAGQTNCYYQPGHPHGFHDHIYLAEIYYCQPLYDPQSVLRNFKARIEQYPKKLKETIIQKYLWEADFSLKTATKAAKRNDTFYVTGCLFRSTACLVQVLFALNEKYFINEKGSIKLASSFSICPNSFYETITSVMEKPGTNATELLANIAHIGLLITDINNKIKLGE